MSGRTPPTGDREAAREFCTPEILRYNGDQLRQQAQHLHDTSVSLVGVESKLDEIKAAAEPEVDSFKGHWQPDGKYDSVFSKAKETSDKYRAEIKAKRERLQKMAAGVQYIADHLDEATAMAAENAKKVNTNIDGKSGDKPTSPSKPAAPAANGPKVEYA